MANRNQRRQEFKSEVGLTFLREAFLSYLTTVTEQNGIPRSRVEDLARGASPAPNELERLGECMIVMTNLALNEEYKYGG